MDRRTIMRKPSISLLLWAVCLTWAGAIQGQISEAQRVADDGALIPARVLLEGQRVNGSGLVDLQAEQARLLLDARYAQFLSSAQNPLDARNIVTALRDYMKKHPDAPHRNRLRAMLAEAYYACGDFFAMNDEMKGIDIEALPDNELERLVVTYGMALTELGRLDEARIQLLTAQMMGGRHKDEATFALAWVDYANRHYDEAVKGFTAVQDIPALREKALFYKAEAALEQSDYEEALARAEAALTELRPIRQQDNRSTDILAELKRIRGEALFGMGRYEQSALQLEEYLAETDTPNREALFRLGLAHYNSGEYLRAPEVLAMVDKTGSDDDAVAQCAELYSGLSYLKTGDATRARMSFERASSMKADEQLREQAMYNHIAALHETGGGAFGESVTVAERFLNEFPASRWTQKVNTYLVETYLSTRNYSAALQSIEKINHPGNVLLDAKQKLLCRSGKEAFAGGEMDKAVDFFTQAVNMGTYDRPTRAEALLWRGEAYYRKGNYAKARTDDSNCLSLSPDPRTALLARYGQAYCYFRQNNYNEACRQFDRFFATPGVATYTDDATRADAWARIGDCNFQARRYSDAVTAYDKALAIDPRTSDYAVYQKAFSQGLLGRYKDKISTLDYLLQQFPSSDYADDALFEKGRSYVQLEQHEGALRTFNQLLDKYPRCSYAPSAGNEIALLLYQMGRTSDAADAYKRVITTYPGSEEANVAMRDLKSLYVEKNQVDSYVEFASQTKGMVTVEVSEHDSLTFAAAEQLYMKGETQRAREAFDKYLTQFPAGAYSLNAHYHLGCIYRQQDNYDKAMAHLRRVAAMRNSRYCEEATRMVADMAYNHKDYGSALAAYKELKTITGRPDVRLHAQTFGVRAAWALSDWDLVISEVGTFVADKGLAPETAVEMRYYRAKACLAKKQNNTAATDLSLLAKDTRTVYGAEAKYLLAQLYYDTGQSEKAEKEVQDYISVSTPHTYWLARSFILLADIYIAGGRDVEARQYLLSLRQNYTTKDDIAGRIEERLAKLQ